MVLRRNNMHQSTRKILKNNYGNESGSNKEKNINLKEFYILLLSRTPGSAVAICLKIIKPF